MFSLFDFIHTFCKWHECEKGFKGMLEETYKFNNTFPSRLAEKILKQ